MSDKKKNIEALKSDSEIAKILNKAEADLEPELNLDISETIEQKKEEIEELKRIDTQDPEKAHKLYYGKLQSLLRRYLPKGEENKEARDMIREQINLFIKDGKEKGRDGRQSYHYKLEEATVMIAEWVNETNGKALIELFNKFRDKNKELGYLDN